MLWGYKDKPGKALDLLATFSFVGETENHNSYSSMEDVTMHCNRGTDRLSERESRKALGEKLGFELGFENT